MTQEARAQTPRAAGALILRLGSTSLDLSERHCIMGILNATPDSFSDGGRYNDVQEAVRRAATLVAEGADIIDIGGESTRPGAADIPVEEECARVLPVVRAVRANFDTPVSIDTRKSEVARRALDAGADMINDVSALRYDPGMAAVAAAADVPVVLMHMQGAPADMQADPRYGDVVEEVRGFFLERVEYCRAQGVRAIVLDPGIGFGKRLEDNLALLRHLDRLADLGYPLLVGTSRKSFIGQITGMPVDRRLGGSIASSVLAALSGARILRVHDVADVRSALQVALSIHRSNR